MVYEAIAQTDLHVASDTSSNGSPIRIRARNSRSTESSLFMDPHEQGGDGARNTGLFDDNVSQTSLAPSKAKSYQRLQTDDFLTQGSRASAPVLSQPLERKDQGGRQPRVSNFSASNLVRADDHHHQRKPPPIAVPQPLRTSSGRSPRLRHPTPDLHVLQGAYMANVEQLEKTAERLSMTSSIEDAIQQLHDEQKRADSRRSSLRSSSIDMLPVTRQFSNTSSIMDINNTARSGGYSPGGYNMISPRSSVSAAGNSSGSMSRGSRFGTRPEPELEGRPLDSFVTPLVLTSPVLSPFASIAEQNEEPATLTQTMIEPAIPPPPPTQESRVDHDDDRPPTSASTGTFEQAQTMFKDFDGEHYMPRSREVSGGRPVLAQRRASGNRLSMARPKSYADPGTGQQMVFYPAPVPTMLNLPQKLSKMPSSMTRDKRRSQILNSIVPAARQSAAWLPDVLETDDDAHLTEDAQMLQKTSFEEEEPRHSMAAIAHLPPQLRASAFFEQSGMIVDQTIEVKGESAVATLDSILDASAFAPINAFTDHAFAGHLGAEVYGLQFERDGKVGDLPDAYNGKLQKRKSLSTLLGRRFSNDPLDTKGSESRRATMSNTLGLRQFRSSSALAIDSEAVEDDGHDDSKEEEVDGQINDHQENGEYHGIPTTLLAELQLRKQQQKSRTRPISAMYPNGVHSTLMELDTVAQVEMKTRKQRHVNLAWEDPELIADASEDDEDVPLGILYQPKVRDLDWNRPLGLMERREMEDNEPLSQRRERLHGRAPTMPRASTMMAASVAAPQDDDQNIAQRLERVKAAGGTATGLPSTRPVSRDFASELMSQFGGDALTGSRRDSRGGVLENSAMPVPEEDETLGQRRKRLQAEREARAKEVGSGAFPPVTFNERPGLKQRHSMADILQAHPAAGGGIRSTSYNMGRASNGLLGLHEQHSMRRSSTMLGTEDMRPSGALGGQQATISGYAAQDQAPIQNAGAYGNLHAHASALYGQPDGNLGTYKDQRTMMPLPNPGLYGGAPMENRSGLYGYNNPMAASMLQLQLQMEQLRQAMGNTMNQGQSERVENWRQSVMH
ncbi:MAG: hypothetical protein M1818_001663 [Claussenomyces sp. TS43310]|nr:MAG: hypothetical protein M1818_001663 [Claussenomyces sp. TS43310]